MECGGISRAWSETFCSTIVSSCQTMCHQNDINYVAASIKTLPIGRYEQLKQFFPLRRGLCKMPIQSCLNKYRAAPCWVPLFSCVKKEEINHFTLRLIMRGCQPVFRAKHGNYVLCSSLLSPGMLRGKKRRGTVRCLSLLLYSHTCQMSSPNCDCMILSKRISRVRHQVITVWLRAWVCGCVWMHATVLCTRFVSCLLVCVCVCIHACVCACLRVFAGVLVHVNPFNVYRRGSR